MINDEIEAQEKYIERFRTAFLLKYGYLPTITIENTEQIVKNYTLNDLALIINQYIPFDIKEKFTSIKAKTRIADIVTLRMIYCMLARDMGYTLNEIGGFLDNKDHSTVLYNNKAGYDLLEYNTKFQDLYINISTRINPKVYPHARINEIVDVKQDNTKSTGTTRVHPRKYNVTKPITYQGSRLSGFER